MKYTSVGGLPTGRTDSYDQMQFAAHRDVFEGPNARRSVIGKLG